MGVNIAEVVNNTKYQIRYTNTKSNYSVVILPKDEQHWENNDWIPSSPYQQYDEVPPYTGSGSLSSGYLNLEVLGHRGFYTFCKITEEDRFQWVFTTPVDGEGGGAWAERRHDMEDGLRHIIKLDEDKPNNVKLTFYKDQTKLRAEAGHIASGIIQKAAYIFVETLAKVFPGGG